jgi:hypothetical protein
MWVVSFTRRPLYPQGKSHWYPLDGLRQKFGELKFGSYRPNIFPTLLEAKCEQYKYGTLRGCIQKFADWVDNEIN